MNDYDSALSYIKKALELNKNLNNPIYHAIIYGNLGEIYMRKGDYAQALKNLNIALEIEKVHDFNSGIIFLYYTIGETHSKAGNFQLTSFFNKSLQLIENTGELREKPYVYNLLSEHYARAGNYQQAFRYAKKHNVLYDSLLNISNLYRIEEIRIKNNLEKTVEENQKLQAENMINKHELSLSKKIINLQLFVIILIGLGFCSLVIFAIYMVKNRRDLRDANQTKKKLFSIIGHDLKGPVGNINQLIELIQQSQNDEREKFIEMLKQPAESSLALLNNLLTWSQSSDKEMIFNPGKVDLTATVREVMTILNPLSAKKEIKWNRIFPKIFLFMQIQIIFRLY